ncbi:hypothetical protein ABZ471_29240 [Streptomyces sp. NPDC005728]|uniref:SCO2400 family protein n=1 Tax=Streptomyces sp. NPDC005728 TaxID=3157054 RepID=UPI0033C5C87E
MDYCSSCRRHLNGALVCPGCGAYAPDIAPVTSLPARATAPAAWYDSDLLDEPAPAAPDETPEFLPSGDADRAPRAPQGRAARRRQLARWKKNKRRAAVATAVALVGGGLTLAALDRQSPDRAQAAAAPDNRTMGATDEQTTAEAQPESTAPGKHRAPSTTTPARHTATGAPRGQTLAAAPRHASPDTHPDAAAAPLPAQTPAAPHQSAAPVSGSTTITHSDTGTTAQQPSTPTPAPATSSGTDTGTSPAAPAPAATHPAQLCLLVVCLG